MSTELNPHEPLITSLSTFYNLLVSLSYTNSNAIIYPPHTGHTNVDVEAAHEAGFGDDAIAVMYLLPYLSEDFQDHFIAVQTRPRSYINTNDMGMRRNPAAASEDMLNYALTLTSTNIAGYALIYYVRTCKYSCCFYRGGFIYTALDSCLGLLFMLDLIYAFGYEAPPFLFNTYFLLNQFTSLDVSDALPASRCPAWAMD